MLIRFFLLFSIALFLGAQDDRAALQKIEQLFLSKSHQQVIEAAPELLSSAKLTLSEKSRLYFYLGEAYAATSQPQEAIKYLMEVDRIDPTSPSRLAVYQRLKDLYQQDETRYQSYLEKIFTQFPKTPQAVSAGKEWASRLISAKTWTKAVEILETMVKLWKIEDKDGVLHMQLATAHAGLRDFVEAVDYLRYVEKNNKELLQNHPENIFTSAQIQYSTRNFEKAVALLTRLINVYRSSALFLDASLLLAQSHEQLKNPYLGAVTLISAMKTSSPGVKRHQLMLLLGQLISQMTMDERLRLENVYPGMTNMEQFLTQVFANAQDLNLKRQACQILARDLRNRQLPEQAVALYLSFLSKKRETSMVDLLKSAMDEWLKQIEEKKDLESLKRLWSTFQNKKSFLSGNNLILLAKQLLDHNMLQPAGEVLAHILRYNMYKSLWIDAQMYQLELFRIEKKYEEMKKILDTVQFQVSRKTLYRWYAWTLAKETKAGQEVIDALLTNLPPADMRDPKARELAFKSIDRLLEKKEFDQATRELQTLWDRKNLLEADRPEITRRLALAAFHLGRLEQALKLYEKLAEIPNEEAWSLFRQISILRQLGREQEALALIEKLKTRYPDSYWSNQIR